MLQLHPYLYLIGLVAAIALGAPLALTITIAVVFIVVTLQRIYVLAKLYQQREAIKAAYLQQAVAGATVPAPPEPTIGLTTD